VRRNCSIPSAERRELYSVAASRVSISASLLRRTALSSGTRLTMTILPDQSMSQNEHRTPVCAARFQDAGCKLLRSAEPLHPQRQ
jgi:hypothetical protein